MFGSLGVTFEEKLVFKIAKFLVGKSANELTHSCKLLNFAQRVFNTSGSNSLEQLTVLCAFNFQSWCFCNSIRNSISYANEESIVNKDSSIDVFG